MLYEKCLNCERLGKGCNGPNFVDMSAKELLEWCKARKALLKMANETISELSGVPKGTINRLFGSGEKFDFYYETMRPIIKTLVAGEWQEHRCPPEKTEQKEPAETVKLLKDQLKWYWLISVSLLILFAIALLMIITALVVDRLNRDIGFFWR